MDKIIYVENLLQYKDVVKRLQSQGIIFDKKKLLSNPGLCVEINRLLEYFGDEEIVE